WFGTRGLTLASLEFFRPLRPRCGFDVANEVLSRIEQKLASQSPSHEPTTGKMLTNYDWSDNNEMLPKLRQRILECIGRLVEEKVLKEGLKPSDVAALLRSALSAG